MKSAMSKAILAGAIAAVFSVSGWTRSAEAGDGRHRGHDRSFGLSVSVGSYGGGFGYASGYPGYYDRPIVRPTCCHYERVVVPGYYDYCGFYHAGYAQLVRVCDVHGRVVVGGY